MKGPPEHAVLDPSGIIRTDRLVAIETEMVIAEESVGMFMEPVARPEHDAAAVRPEVLDVEFGLSAQLKGHLPAIFLDWHAATAAVADLLEVMEPA